MKLKLLIGLFVAILLAVAGFTLSREKFVVQGALSEHDVCTICSNLLSSSLFRRSTLVVQPDGTVVVTARRMGDSHRSEVSTFTNDSTGWRLTSTWWVGDY